MAHIRSVSQDCGFTRRRGRGWLLWIPDGRANPLMDRKVVGMSNSPSLCPSILPSIYLSFFSVYWSTYLSTYPSIHLLSSLSVFAAVHPSSYFVYVSICLSFFLFLSFEICPFPHLSICLSTQFDSKPVTLAQKRNRANRPGFQFWCNLQNLKCETSLLASAPAFA